MALVDYSSDSDAEAEKTGDNATKASHPALPSLPAAFHDLYASTSRPSAVDDPSLHQGRKRAIPHVAGNWPSHIYIEWHPTTSQHEQLSQLVMSIQKGLNGSVEVRSLLTSELGTPLPLHISLSRPFVLATAEKDDFVNRLNRSFAQSESAAFSVHPAALRWYHSPDSARSFLVLQVRGTSGAGVDANTNTDLTALLARCNALVRSFGQPELYTAPLTAADGEPAGSAFHVSIAWAASDQWAQHGTSDQPQSLSILSGGSRIAEYNILVDCIKVKVGNVINSIPLHQHRKA